MLNSISGATMALTLISSVFANNGAIPSLYTCQGSDIAPPISWSNIPKEAKSLVLIMDDPDAPDPAAPKMTYVHWLLYNIPVTSAGLPESVTEAQLPPGTLQGKNGWHKTGYGGPCPPIGRHRYFFKLYALDTVLPNLNTPSKEALEAAMKPHIIEKTELIGTYIKTK